MFLINLKWIFDNIYLQLRVMTKQNDTSRASFFPNGEEKVRLAAKAKCFSLRIRMVLLSIRSAPSEEANKRTAYSKSQLKISLTYFFNLKSLSPCLLVL